MKIQRDRFVMIVSIFLFLFAIEARIYYYYAGQDINTSYESINIQNISTVNVSEKLQGISTSLLFLYRKDDFSYHFQEVVKEMEIKNEYIPTWHLPTEMGIISQNPHYSHMALDITSPRGSGEVIYPVYDGVISGIYTDIHGALIVTILHDINGKKYSSQYVHLSRYQDGLYVGKTVSYLDPIGWMGTTGYSTGVHLHLAVLDCALFDSTDTNCKDLNGFFRYGNQRVSEGYLGLGSHIIVPANWNQRF